MTTGKYDNETIHNSGCTDIQDALRDANESGGELSDDMIRWVQEIVDTSHPDWQSSPSAD